MQRFASNQTVRLCRCPPGKKDFPAGIAANGTHIRPKDMHMHYDLIIKNGTVINPATGFMGKRDLYVKGGVFAEGDPDAEAGRIIDAEGAYVTPGLIDSHTHTYEGGNVMAGRADIIFPPSCVTTAIDAGSAGTGNVGSFYRDRLACATTIKAAVGASRNGVQEPPYEEIQDPACVTPAAMLPVFRKYGDFLIGLKLRVHGCVTGKWRLEALRQSRETARVLRGEGYRCRRMIHMGPFAPDVELRDVLDLLDAGDVITHIYRPDNGATILGKDGRVQACAREARERGVVFETGCGRTHLCLESARKAFADGFLPQIISTDQVGYTFFRRPSGWLLLKVSTYLNLGMALEDAVKAVTYTPAATYGILDEAGTLKEGCPADVAVFTVEDRQFLLEDLCGGSLRMEKLCVPMATVKHGAPVFQQIYFGI